MKKIIAAVLAMSLAFAGTGCGAGAGDGSETQGANTGANGTLTKVTMAANPFVGLAPIYIAMEKGYFKTKGIDFSMVDFDDSSASCSALLAGKADIAYATLDATVIAESQYQENMLNIVSAVDESAGADGILVKNNIKSLADLKNKTIGVSVNQTSHYLLLQALEKAKLTDKDVKLVNMTSSDAGVSFISGSLDAAVTWEPYLSNAVKAGVGKLIFSSADAPGSIMDVLAVEAKNKGKAWVANVNQAIQMGVDYLNNESTREDAVKIVSKRLEVGAEETKSMLSTVKIYGNKESDEALKAGGLVRKAAEKISKFYLDKGIMQREIKTSALFDGQ